MASEILINRKQTFLNGRFVAHIKVLSIDVSKKHPDGIKAKFVLLNAELGSARLLVDNHEPFGYHMHTKLPEDKSHRVELGVVDYMGALDIFLAEVERILKDEK